MVWRCPAACRIVPQGSKLTCASWHRACGSYTFTHIFLQLSIYLWIREEIRAASPCLLPKGSLNWWGVDVRPEGKGEETPASAGWHPKYLPGSSSVGAGAAPSEAEMSARLPMSQHCAGSATAPTWGHQSPGVGRSSLRGGGGVMGKGTRCEARLNFILWLESH